MRPWKHLDESFPTPPFSFVYAPLVFEKLVSENRPSGCVFFLRVYGIARVSCPVVRMLRGAVSAFELNERGMRGGMLWSFELAEVVRFYFMARS